MNLRAWFDQGYSDMCASLKDPAWGNDQRNIERADQQHTDVVSTRTSAGNDAAYSLGCLLALTERWVDNAHRP